MNIVLVLPLVVALGVTVFMAKRQRAERGSEKPKQAKTKARTAKVKAPKATAPKLKAVKMPKLTMRKSEPAMEPVPAMAGAVIAPAGEPAPTRNAGGRQPRRGSVL